MLNLSLVKSLVKPHVKLSKKDLVLLTIIFCLTSLLILSSLSILVLRSTGLKLRAENNDLNSKVGSLQGDLKDIGQRLSGLSSEEVKESEEQKQVVLSRIGLVATPGETSVTVDAPEGWSLVGENRLTNGGATVAVQSEDIDLLTIPNYTVARIIDVYQIKSGQTAFIVFIKTTGENKGYLGLSFCNPETGAACSFKGGDGKFVFILAHGYRERDQFVRDMDFNSVEGIKLLTDFKTMVRGMEVV